LLLGQSTGIVSSTSPGAAWTFTIWAQRTSACTESFALSSLLHSRIWFRRDDALHTSQNAELFCEIRMMRRSAILIARNAMDAHYYWLLLESLTQQEGALLKRQIFRRLFFD